MSPTEVRAACVSVVSRSIECRPRTHVASRETERRPVVVRHLPPPRAPLELVQLLKLQPAPPSRQSLALLQVPVVLERVAPREQIRVPRVAGVHVRARIDAAAPAHVRRIDAAERRGKLVRQRHALEVGRRGGVQRTLPGADETQTEALQGKAREKSRVSACPLELLSVPSHLLLSPSPPSAAT